MSQEANLQMFVTEYKTLKGSSSIELDRQVNASLKEGFVLYGAPRSAQGFAVQTVVKLDKRITDALSRAYEGLSQL